MFFFFKFWRLETFKFYFWKLFNLNVDLNIQKPRNFNQVLSSNQFIIQFCVIYFLEAMNINANSYICKYE